MREALFSIVGQDLAGQRILDAFGGAGLIGLEAWSRGATVTVVERDRRTLEAIRRRGEDLGAAWTVRGGDVLRLAESLDRFDGVFADPPYADDPRRVLDVLAPIASDWLVLETAAATVCPAAAGALTLDRSREYGSTKLWVYRR